MMAQENVKQKMRFIEVLLIMVAVTLLIIPPAWADSPPPVTTLNVYFERNNIPVNETVKFTVNCSALSCKPGFCPPLDVINKFGDIFSFSAICPSYGCFMTSYQYEDYEHLTSCDLSGELDGEKFTLLNMKNPFSCTMIDRNTRLCELRINISSGNITAIETQATNITSTPINHAMIMMSSPVKTVETKGIFDEFICFVKNLLGGTC